MFLSVSALQRSPGTPRNVIELYFVQICHSYWLYPVLTEFAPEKASTGSVYTQKIGLYSQFLIP